VQYLVLPDTTNPYLLARVRWPDVFQAISAARPYWQDDPGLFDLPYDPNSIEVTLERATAIATDWGARLPSDETTRALDPSLIRRMPADWSNLSPAEQRAWSLEFVKSGRPAPARKPTGSGRGRRGWWRRRVSSAAPGLPAPVDPSPELPIESQPAILLAEISHGPENDDGRPPEATVPDPRDENPDASPLVNEPSAS
jgi:hypothetical protein